MTLPSIPFSRSFIKMLNNTEISMDPWGTSYITLLQDNAKPFMNDILVLHYYIV